VDGLAIIVVPNGARDLLYSGLATPQTTFAQFLEACSETAPIARRQPKLPIKPVDQTMDLSIPWAAINSAIRLRA